MSIYETRWQPREGAASLDVGFCYGYPARVAAFHLPKTALNGCIAVAQSGHAGSVEMKRVEFTKSINVPAQFGVGIDTENVKSLYGQARAIKLEVVDAVLLIENTLSAIIAHYFFPGASEKKAPFQSLVLRTNWCTLLGKARAL